MKQNILSPLSHCRRHLHSNKVILFPHQPIYFFITHFSVNFTLSVFIKYRQQPLKMQFVSQFSPPHHPQSA